MARRKRTSPQVSSDPTDPRIDLLRAVRLLQEHLTQAVAEAVFSSLRVTERVRDWTLHALVQFWTAVVLRAPKALSAALHEAQGQQESGWPTVPATSEQAFFQRCQEFRWEFFAGLFDAFVAQVTKIAPTTFGAEVSHLAERFSEIWALDGSRLDAVAHRLKILWDVRSKVLPGCLEVGYDLLRGIPRAIHFDADAAKGELQRAIAILDAVPKEALLVGDRLYSSLKFFAALADRGIFGVFRRNRTVSYKKLRRLSRVEEGPMIIEDWLVLAGTGQTSPPRELRSIKFQYGSKRYEALTNVLDPERLSAEDVVDLYPLRWGIERMFFDLKEVLNLHRFYCGSPNAVGMQVYAAALVYVAFRVAQAEIAKEHGMAPEDISTQKLFPKIAAAAHGWAVTQLTVAEMRRANPGVALKEPDWNQAGYAATSLRTVLLEPRSPLRRKRRFCKGRRHWKSFAHVRGGKRYVRR